MSANAKSTGERTIGARFMRMNRKHTRKKARRLSIAYNKRRRELWHQTAHHDRSIGERAVRYYGPDGWPISQRSWIRLIELRNRQHIALTPIGGGTWVSTVWLGIDHNWSGVGAPIIFETMVFGGPLDQGPQWRYCTRQEALDGHELVCLYARAAAAGALVLPADVDEAVAS